MTKQKLKEIVKNHKKEIVLGVGAIVIGGAVFVTTKRKPKLPPSMDESTKLYLEMLKVIDDARDGAKMYIQVVPEDFKEICGRDEMILRDASGKFLKANGGIIFGNIIEE